MHLADNLDGCWWAIELDGTRHDRAVRTWDTPPADCPALASLAVVHHDLVEHGAPCPRKQQQLSQARR